MGAPGRATHRSPVDLHDERRAAIAHVQLDRVACRQHDRTRGNASPGERRAGRPPQHDVVDGELGHIPDGAHRALLDGEPAAGERLECQAEIRRLDLGEDADSAELDSEYRNPRGAPAPSAWRSFPSPPSAIRSRPGARAPDVLREMLRPFADRASAGHPGDRRSSTPTRSRDFLTVATCSCTA
jgi:hypothetical protein